MSVQFAPRIPRGHDVSPLVPSRVSYSNCRDKMDSGIDFPQHSEFERVVLGWDPLNEIDPSLFGMSQEEGVKLMELCNWYIDPIEKSVDRLHEMSRYRSSRRRGDPDSLMPILAFLSRKILDSLTQLPTPELAARRPFSCEFDDWKALQITDEITALMNAPNYQGTRASPGLIRRIEKLQEVTAMVRVCMVKFMESRLADFEREMGDPKTDDRIPYTGDMFAAAVRASLDSDLHGRDEDLWPPLQGCDDGPFNTIYRCNSLAISLAHRLYAPCRLGQARTIKGMKFTDWIQQNRAADGVAADAKDKEGQGSTA